MKTLQEAFTTWLDFDGAEFELAKCLGLFPDVPWDPKYKHFFWTANPFGDQLYNILEALVVMGALEQNADRQFRYNTTFKYEKAIETIETDQ